MIPEWIRDLPRRLVAASVKWPRRVYLVWAIVCVAAFPFVVSLSIETSTESVLERESDDWAFYQYSKELFGGDEVVVAMLKAEDRFGGRTLRRVRSLSSRFEAMRGVRRVDSLATVPLVRQSSDGTVRLDGALERGIPSSRKERQELENHVLTDEIAEGNLISSDGRWFAVNLVLGAGSNSHYGSLLRTIRDALGNEGSISGVPIFRVEAGERTRTDLVRFVPLTLIVIAGLLFLVFRSARGVLVPLLASGIASWLVLGVMGALGRPLTITTVILPSLLLAMGCAYCIHVLVASKGMGESARRNVEDISGPISLSALTTALGFFAVSFVDIEAIRDVGFFGALGVLFLLATTLTVVPALTASESFSVGKAAGAGWISSKFSRCLVRFVSRRIHVIIGVWLFVGLTLGWGVARLDVETDVVNWFPRDSEIREDYNRIRRELSGISPMNVIIEAPNHAKVTDPEAVRAIAGLTGFLEGLPAVGKAWSVVDLIEQLHEGFTDGQTRRFPEDSSLIEQYMLVLESKTETRDLITSDYQFANVLLRVDDNSSRALLGVAQRAEKWWAQRGPKGFRARTTGVMYEFARAEQEIAYGQLEGLAFAFLAMAGVFILVFRSAKLAVVGLVPNLAPLAIAFGVMGLARIPLDAGTVLVGNLAFGIAVDDTVHTLSRFDAYRRQGQSRMCAMVGSYRAVLPALCYSTFAVAFGFAALGASEFLLTQRFGLLMGGVMVVCLAADLLLLPAFLLVGDGAGRRGGRKLRGDEGVFQGF